MTGPRRRSLPIRARLAFYYVAVLAVILAALGIFLVTSMRTGLRVRAHDSLEAAFRPLAARLADPSSKIDLATYLHGGEISNESGLEVIGQILDQSGRIVQTSGDPGTATPMVDSAVLDQAARTGHWHEPRRLAGRPGEDIVVVLPIQGGPMNGEFVVLAQTLHSADVAVHRLTLLLLLAAPVALALAFLGGLRVAGVALGPVDTMTRTAAAIDASEAGKRLPEPARDDELGRLARTLNAMLARLDSALERERRFAADASHELRTPLALMAAEIDVALRAAGGMDDPRATLSSLREEVTRLTSVTENLLVLSRAGSAAGLDVALQDTDLFDLALSVVARLQPLAQAGGVEVALDGEVVHAQADPFLMGQAITNLVENAIRHSGPGSAVSVRVVEAGGARIEVTDNGPGIPADDLPHLFDPFYRVDRARARETGSFGLGLAICRAVVEAHGGRVGVTSEVGQGSTFAITLRD